MKLEKRALQLTILVAGLVPVLAGCAGMIAGVAMVGHAVAAPALDSHFRYLSGLLLGVGLGFWASVPDIERKTGQVRLLTAMVVIGGLARACGLIGGETPGLAMRLALVMELGVTPLICLWQARIAAVEARARQPRFRPPVGGGTAPELRPDPNPGR